jgi:hypothetical protein
MTAPGVRRADFLMALAYATDLATGHSRDFALRSCVLAMRFAEVAGLDESMRRKVYHQALLRYIGCNADTHLLAADVLFVRVKSLRRRMDVNICIMRVIFRGNRELVQPSAGPPEISSLTEKDHWRRAGGHQAASLRRPLPCLHARPLTCRQTGKWQYSSRRQACRALGWAP